MSKTNISQFLYQSRLSIFWLTNINCAVVYHSIIKKLSHLKFFTEDFLHTDQRMKAIEMKKLTETVNTLEGNRTAMESEMAEQQKKINDENEKLGSLTEGKSCFYI